MACTLRDGGTIRADDVGGSEEVLCSVISALRLKIVAGKR